ncbi:MAG: histidine kinase [Pseudomonadota bacterium]
MGPNSATSGDAQGRRHLVWLTLGIWGLDVAFNVLPVLIAGKVRPTGFMAALLLATIGLILSPALYRACAWLRARRAGERYAGLALVTFLFGAMVATADVTLGAWMRAAIDPTRVEPTGNLLTARVVSNLLAFAWMFGLLGAFYMMMLTNRALLEHERQLADARTQAAEAEGQATAARLAALRYQLNPHFLFNTLNAVSSAVIRKRNGEAEAMLDKLAGFLRVTLAADPEGMIPLEDELATLQAYLEIEAVRFRERLGLDFSCPDELRGAVVPSFILQPLIENAIKHGVSRSSDAVTIRLEVNRDGDDLVVLIEDDAERSGEPARSGGGLGLQNIRERLKVLYGPRGVLQTTSRERGYLALVRMPLIQTLKSRARAA